MFGFLKVLASNLLKGPSTDPFPFAEAHTPARFRGKVKLDPALCVGCSICVHVCAGGAIRINEREDGSGYDFTVWHNTCALCAMCRHYCPTGAITLSNDWHNAHRQSEKYDWCERQFVPFVACEGCGKHIRPLPPALATRAYASGAFDVASFLRLCPSCRQVAAANSGELVFETPGKAPSEEATTAGAEAASRDGASKKNAAATVAAPCCTVPNDTTPGAGDATTASAAPVNTGASHDEQARI